ncbi:MAG: terpene cyclase/mutase family protein [Acidobacteriaceae bacterium]|nr:terpene cyclase/mutase family protein [Acidobacteriaceae bacterium]MBV9778481.1 terpene cyclase/mutase family protein [Acidobacteriaceae bacterium]
MAEAENLQRNLLETQNADGGWAYGRGSSWTEPTAFALLALETRGKGAAHERGCAWLLSKQRTDGGWSPHPSVNVSTWVTSLAVFALADANLTAQNRDRAYEWIVGQIKPEFSPLQRIVMRWQGVPRNEETSGGSPWFPNTAAWIAPTVMSVLALSDALRKTHAAKLQAEVSRSKQYILSRRCLDGGWNHGGTSYRSQNAASYPEMTGMALLGLRGVPASELDRSIDLAERNLSSPGSIEGLSWLQLGLMQHGRDCRDIKTDLACRTIRNVSLRLLALADPFTNRLLNQPA